MRHTSATIPALVLAVMSCIGGCESAPVASPMRTHHQSMMSPTLVMPGAVDYNGAMSFDQLAMHDDNVALFGRNDHLLGSFGGEHVASVETLVVRQREFLRTINGRPRDYSTHFFFSTKRGMVR